MESRSEKHVMEKEYTRSERLSLHLSRMNSPPHLLYCIYLPYFGSSTNTSSFITSSEISNLLLKKKQAQKKPPADAPTAHIPKHPPPYTTQAQQIYSSKDIYNDFSHNPHP